MVNPPAYIVYQAYGITDVLNEVIVSVASLIKTTKETVRPAICIYTDSVEYLQNYLPEEIIYIHTLKEVWEEWKGPHHFVHRAKIRMLMDFCARYDGNVLYCDTDTYFLHDPSGLFAAIGNGSYIMHTDEGRLKGTKNKVFQKLEKFLRTYSHPVALLSSDIHMWNAGVLGFQTKDQPVLQQVLSLSDDLYSRYQKHVMEQLSFSLYFSYKNRISCEETIFHYWDFKEYRQILSVFFEKNNGRSFGEWSGHLEEILPMELIKEKKRRLQQPYLKRKLLQFLGRAK